VAGQGPAPVDGDRRGALRRPGVGSAVPARAPPGRGRAGRL